MKKSYSIYIIFPISYNVLVFKKKKDMLDIIRDEEKEVK